MPATICPTILAGNADEYREQVERIAQFATRVHIDLADGRFAPTKTIAMDQVWWPGGVRADLHVMYQEPFKHTKLLLSLGPQLIIVHAEADGDFIEFAEIAHAHGIEVGVALKAESPPELIEPALDFIDYVLVFSGNLGHFGGQANTHLLTKVLRLRQMKPTLEIGWDGGINNQNAATLAAGGVDVLNVGGFIQHAANPQAAYEQLHMAVTSPHHHKAGAHTAAPAPAPAPVRPARPAHPPAGSLHGRPQRAPMRRLVQ
jgi:ribulose-phosphate 3-epimerase